MAMREARQLTRERRAGMRHYRSRGPHVRLMPAIGVWLWLYGSQLRCERWHERYQASMVDGNAGRLREKMLKHRCAGGWRGSFRHDHQRAAGDADRGLARHRW